MCDDKLSLIASMAATLEAGDRAYGLASPDPATYAFNAYELYAAALEEIRVRDEATHRKVVGQECAA